MNDISIKILDILYDLCEDDGYQILEADEIFAHLPDHDFGTDELVTIFEGLSADGLVDLKYADTNEFCISLKLKGRTLIKQSRDRLAQIISSTYYNPEEAQAKKKTSHASKSDTVSGEGAEGESDTDSSKSADDGKVIEADVIEPSAEQVKVSDTKSDDTAKNPPATSKKAQQKAESSSTKSETAQEVPIRERVRVQVSPNLARGFTATNAVSSAVGEKKIKYGRIFWAALFGSFFGTALVIGALYALKYFGIFSIC